jgi:hypothetical protein
MLENKVNTYGIIGIKEASTLAQAKAPKCLSRAETALALTAKATEC